MGARKRRKFELDVAPDVQRRIEEIVAAMPDEFEHVDAARVVCFRSRGSTARIYARIWGLDRIWQMALGVDAHYAIEVVELFDRSPEAEQDRTLLHELMHIPKTFSGALVPHVCFGKRIDCSTVEVLYKRLVRHRAALARAAALAQEADAGRAADVHASARPAASVAARRETPLESFGP